MEHSPLEHESTVPVPAVSGRKIEINLLWEGLKERTVQINEVTLP